MICKENDQTKASEQVSCGTNYWQMYGVFKSSCHSERIKFPTQMATLQQDSDIITVIILSLHSLINQWQYIFNELFPV